MNNILKGISTSVLLSLSLSSNRPPSLDASFVPWSTDLRQHLLSEFPLVESLSPIPDEVLLDPKWTLSLMDDGMKDNTGFGEDHIGTGLSRNEPISYRD